jgi:hypothetical protein
MTEHRSIPVGFPVSYCADPEHDTSYTQSLQETADLVPQISPTTLPSTNSLLTNHPTIRDNLSC